MAIWGGSAVENLLPMVFGIVIATTSSIFIAAPILLLLGNWWQGAGGRQRRHQGNPGQGLTLRAGPSTGRRGFATAFGIAIRSAESQVFSNTCWASEAL
jgi:hypothetical protein